MYSYKWNEWKPFYLIKPLQTSECFTCFCHCCLLCSSFIQGRNALFLKFHINRPVLWVSYLEARLTPTSWFSFFWPGSWISVASLIQRRCLLSSVLMILLWSLEQRTTRSNGDSETSPEDGKPCCLIPVGEYRAALRAERKHMTDCRLSGFRRSRLSGLSGEVNHQYGTQCGWYWTFKSVYASFVKRLESRMSVLS